METDEQVIQETAQRQEEINPQTKVVTASLDGVNVAVREKGTKVRRPKSVKKNAPVTQKPEKKSADDTQSTSKSQKQKGKPSGEEEKNCCYKNAMVATITYYGEKQSGQ